MCALGVLLHIGFPPKEIRMNFLTRILVVSRPNPYVRIIRNKNKRKIYYSSARHEKNYISFNVNLEGSKGGTT